MIIFIIMFLVCYWLASLDTTKDKPAEKNPIVLREDAEFADLITRYLKGEEI